MSRSYKLLNLRESWGHLNLWLGGRMCRWSGVWSKGVSFRAVSGYSCLNGIASKNSTKHTYLEKKETHFLKIDRSVIVITNYTIFGIDLLIFILCGPTFSGTRFLLWTLIFLPCFPSLYLCSVAILNTHVTTVTVASFWPAPHSLVPPYSFSLEPEPGWEAEWRGISCLCLRALSPLSTLVCTGAWESHPLVL